MRPARRPRPTSGGHSESYPTTGVLAILVVLIVTAGIGTVGVAVAGVLLALAIAVAGDFSTASMVDPP